MTELDDLTLFAAANPPAVVPDALVDMVFAGDRLGVPHYVLARRLAKIRTDRLADPGRCDFCESELPSGGRSRYCAPRCSKAMSRARARQADRQTKEVAA